MDRNDLNRSLQLNPNNDAYWRSRGYPERPPNWRELIENDDDYSSDEYEEESDENNEDYSSESDEYDDGDYDSDSSTSTTESEWRLRREWANYSNQLNPNNVAYWKARGYADRPYNWKSLI